MIAHEYRRDEWRDEAACADSDPDLFFPTPGGSATEAKAICAGCPVRDECLADAIRTGEEYGVRGGVSARQRRFMAHGRGRLVALPAWDGRLPR